MNFGNGEMKKEEDFLFFDFGPSFVTLLSNHRCQLSYFFTCQLFFVTFINEGLKATENDNSRTYLEQKKI